MNRNYVTSEKSGAGKLDNQSDSVNPDIVEVRANRRPGGGMRLEHLPEQEDIDIRQREVESVRQGLCPAVDCNSDSRR